MRMAQPLGLQRGNRFGMKAIPPLALFVFAGEPAHGQSQRALHQRQLFAAQTAQMLPKPGFFQGAHLLAQDDGRPAHAALRRLQRHMGAQRGFAHTRGEGRAITVGEKRLPRSF